ncbi:hypothetical protein PV350_41175 [Streptomyces sp. PA03-6a]|nr:hypothetical protein [Streptomyces sp. PA03-6a]
MDPRTVILADSPLWSGTTSLMLWAWRVLLWMLANAVWLSLAAASCWVAWDVLRRYLATRALKERAYVELVPGGQFETSEEEILRFGAQLIRAASAGK